MFTTHSNVSRQAEVGESRGCSWAGTFIAATPEQLGQLVVLRESYVAEVTWQGCFLGLASDILAKHVYGVQDSVLLTQQVVYLCEDLEF